MGVAMRKQFLAMMVLFSVAFGFGGAVAADSASGSEFIGTWNGTWEGSGGSGRFDLTLTKGADGKVEGGVSVGSDTGDYVAKFISVSFNGNAMTARYSYTPDEQADIAVTATFEGKVAKGTWSMVPKGEDTAMATGTWTVTKK
jgi:hypothetical protein